LRQGNILTSYALMFGGISEHHPIVNNEGE